MSNKVFVFLVVLLSVLIICSFIALMMSLSKYHTISYPNEKPSILDGNHYVPSQPTQVQNDNVPQPKPAVAGFILPSNEREITSADISGLSKDELNKAYNEIFARYGHDFKSQDLKDYFLSTSWYTPITGKTVSMEELTDIERKNVSIIKNRIDELK